MIRAILTLGAAIAVWLGGAGLGGVGLAQSLRLPPIPQAARGLFVDDDNDKHQHGKNKHRGEEDNDDEDHGRGRRSSTPGSWRGYPAMPGYYYPPPASSYATPYAPYAPAAPPTSALPPTRMGAEGAPPPAAATEPNRGAGSSAPSIQWVDPAPAR